MNQLIAVAFGGLAVVAASAAHGQDRSTLHPDAGYMFGTGSAASGGTPGEPLASPLFNLGGLDIGVWAPVEPHYNADGGRDPAGEPFWGMEEFRRATAFRTIRPAGVAPFSMPDQSSVAISRGR
jgi:hypothetical protein